MSKLEGNSDLLSRLQAFKSVVVDRVAFAGRSAGHAGCKLWVASNDSAMCPTSWFDLGFKFAVISHLCETSDGWLFARDFRECVLVCVLTLWFHPLPPL